MTAHGKVVPWKQIIKLPNGYEILHTYPPQKYVYDVALYIKFQLQGANIPDPLRFAISPWGY